MPADVDGLLVRAEAFKAPGWPRSLARLAIFKLKSPCELHFNPMFGAFFDVILTHHLLCLLSLGQVITILRLSNCLNSIAVNSVRLPKDSRIKLAIYVLASSIFPFALFMRVVK